MKLIKFITVIFLISFIFESWGFCQFRIIPHINLEIDVEEGYLYPPHKLVLVGVGDENMGVRSIELDFDKRKYSVYNVKPGKYLLSIADDNADIIFQYQTVTILYPDEDAFYRKNTDFLNIIEINNNRNLKLKIIFKMHDDYHGYRKVRDVKYKDFDYSEFIFCSTPFSSELKTNIREAKQVDYSICGNNTGWTERSLGFSCSLDNGNIKLNIDKAYFKNEYLGQKSAPFTLGNTTLGPSTNYGGVTSVTGYLLDDYGQNNPLPNDWDEIEVSAICDYNKILCDIIINYRVAILMKTAVWKKEELCQHRISYDGKTVYDNNNTMKSQCYCDCLLEAIIAHEAEHCEQWIDSTNELRNILNGFCNNNQNNYQTIVCCTDEECQEYAENEMAYQILGEINWIFKDTVINHPEIYSPEGPSESVELSTFRRCGRPCKYK